MLNAFRKKPKKKVGTAGTLAAFVLFVLITVSLVTAFSDSCVTPVKAEAPAAGTYNIRSAQEFIQYSIDYANGLRHHADVINISINEGSVITDDGFISLGTAEHPFAGTINIPSAGIDIFHLFDCPLFDYVSTDLRITGAGNVKIMRERVSESPADGVLTSGALFANHVTAGSNPASWNITLLPYEGEGNESSSYTGLIGDIAANAEVTVTFTNTSTIPVSGTGSTGLICGTLNAGATLNVTTAGSGAALSVTGAGHTGSLVGEMKSGSTLKFNSANNSRVTAVTSSGGYAGGVVGCAENVTIDYASGVTDYAVSGRVTGSAGAGGIFGKYVNTVSPAVFTLEDSFAIASGTNISSGNGYTGGVFGLLENRGAVFKFDGNSASDAVTVTLSNGKYRGGVCGGYQASALSNTFELYDTSTTVTASMISNAFAGGLIGTLTTSPGYVNIHDVSCTSSGSINGGLVGTAGSGGSFIDITGNVTVSGVFDAGIVADLQQGVLRMSGLFDLSLFEQQGLTSGYLVKDRNRALVYACGNGSGTAGNWTVKRHLSRTIDDIHTWGEVIRTDGTILKESDLFTVDMSAHTVTLAAAPSGYNIGTVTDFAKTALNVKLNTEAGTGALQFTSGSANSSATILSSTITLTSNISLSGTGLLGLTRDDGGNAAFAGTFDGGSNTITFATGENYGLQPDGSALDASSKQGNIYQHTYNGLFAETSNATVKDLTVSGVYKIYQTAGGVRAGGVTAYAEKGLALDNVKSDFSLRSTVAGDFTGYYGGAVGVAGGNGLDVDIENCDLHPDVSENSTVGGDSIVYYGGAIGLVSSGDATNYTQSLDFVSSDLGLTYNKTGSANRASCFGGAICGVGNCIYTKDKRQIKFDDVDVTVNVTGRSKSSRFGAIIGMDWYACDVTLDDVRADGVITSTEGAGEYGGLFRTASGHWDSKKITVTRADFNLPSASGSSFGFFTNKTYCNGSGTAQNALYLDLNNVGSNYDIAALSITGPTFSYFDEIAANSRFNGTGLQNNGNSIISITTSGDIINTSGSFNTYLNKTAYGQTAAGKNNPNTRYYYNIAYARANTAAPKYNFLVWSVKQYAHSSLAPWFASSSTFTGDLDMTGLSYYPVDLTTGVTFSSAVLKLDNVLMENSVKYAYTGETGTRSTRTDADQHYRMHSAVFRNDPGSSITVNGLTLQGNVPKYSDSFCGFLVAGTLGNSDSYNVKFNADNVTFDGAHIITVSGGDITDTSYAPLLVNKVGKNTSLTLSNSSQTTTAYSTYASGGKYAGSSLVGDVGDSTARAIYLTFTGLKFDGRSSAVSIGNMDTAYGTTKSIFSRATILNSFLYSGESSGTYNYEIDEDWSGGGTAIHNVTYGKEVTTSLEFAGRQKNYYGSGYFTHPVSYQSAGEYDFSTGFLPHVYVSYNLSEYKHEIAVNVTFNSEIEGCGKYDDPFIIDDDTKLYIIAEMINGQDVGNTVVIHLPSDLTNFDYTATGYTKNKYNFGTSDFISSNGGTTRSNVNVRRYLAGAYYVITKDITLPYDYRGLGTVDDNNNTQYAFRGVLIGRNITITNTSRNPLIHTSLGSVIKNITVDVDVDYDSSNVITLAAPLGSDQYNYISGLQSYGAVIGQILGGDNIIDNVDVVFTDVSFSITEATASHYQRLTPVGGYVGTLFNGGLIFRNMTSSNVGLTSSVFDKVADAGYLYVNPIIGRVIAGYAFHETSAYAVTSASIPNGNKNYTIPDLSLSAGKLSVSGTGPFTVEIPDGQAMFVLGAIINSGAASAAYNASTEQAYQNLSGFWQAYRAHTTTRAGSSYTTVGTSSGSDYTAACLDKYTNGLVKVPYIIYAYSNKTGSVYLTRCLATKADNTVKVTGDCNVAAGFRGIGSIYLNSSYVRLGIKKFGGVSGSSSYNRTITLNMRFIEYDHKSVSNYIAVPASAGFGLFNTVVINSPSQTNSINCLVMSGSVYYDVYTVLGNQSKYLFTNYTNDKYETGSPVGETVDNINRLTYLSAGGVIGYTNTRYYIYNVTFNDFSVEGAKTSGGLVGYSVQKDNNISTIKYGEGVTSSGSVSVIGGLQAGGLIGRIFDTKTEIIGDSSGFTDIIIKTVEMKSETPTETGLVYYANLTTGVGGVIGSCWNSRGGDGTEGNEQDSIHGAKAAKVRRLFITNINVTKGSTDAVIRVRNNSSSELQFNYAGGFIGSCHNALMHIYDCKLTDVSVTGNTAGGLVGRMTQKFFLHVHNVTIDGNSRHSSITGTSFSGGTLGWINARDDWYFEYDGVVVKDYNIISSNTSNAVCAAGGMIGFAEGDNKTVSTDTNRICEFNNIAVSGCLIETNYTNVNNNTGTGGVIGLVNKYTIAEGNKTNNANCKFKFSGYNMLIDSVSLVHKNGGSADDSNSASNRKIGDIIGNNAVSTTVKFVGVSLKYPVGYIYCGKHIGYYNNTDENYGSDGTYGTGYVIFADFNAVQTNETFSTIDAAVSSDDYDNVGEASPYVTANPSHTVGSVKFTGDGVAASVEDLAIFDIIADTSTGSYKYAAAAYYTGSSGDTNFTAVNSYLSKLAMFRSEASTYLGTDFPVLILEDTSRESSHKMINSYIRMLTNTRYDYGYDTAGVYAVQIYNMVYEDRFTPYATGSSLKRDGGQFYMLNSQFDSGKTQFSLIDVRFFNPADTSETAYHLYIPVFVKKVLSFSFDIAELSGTDYLSSLYTSRYGQALIENVGMPVTLYFQYTYSRTPEEWAEAINAGEDVDRNYDKDLQFYKANTNEILQPFPDETVLVLVDPNKGGKPYYATLEDAITGNTLNLGAFKSVMTSDGAGGYTFSGDTFEPVDLSELMTLTVTPDTSGLTGTLVPCAAADATVTVGSQGYRLATDEEIADTTVVKSMVSVSSVEAEKYYLSIYTESNAVNDELFHYYLITTPSSFDDSLHPSKITDTNAHTMVHLVMGKIFHHSNIEVLSNSSTGSPLMTAGNNIITVDFSVEVGLSDDLDSDIKPDIQNLMSATTVYQSFLLYLNRKENVDVRKEILGSPTVAGSYCVDYTINQTADGGTTSYSGEGIRSTQNYAEFVTGDLSSYFASGNHFEINSTVSLTYSADAIPTQFPGRTDLPPADTNGVSVSGASNIAFQQTATTYTKNSIEADETPAKSYYSEAQPEIATLDLNPIGDRVGDFTPLGVNALNNNDATVASFDLMADLNTGMISERVENYVDAQVTIRLSKKQADGTYGDYLDISTYMTVEFEGITGGLTHDSTSYTQIIPRANVTGNAALVELPIIHCRVLTGSALEAAGFTYGNYKITVTVVLRDLGGNKISVSQASNYVIYTNAKIIPEYILAS